MRWARHQPKPRESAHTLSHVSWEESFQRLLAVFGIVATFPLAIHAQGLNLTKAVLEELPYGATSSPGAAAARRLTHSGATSPRRRLVTIFNRAAAMSAVDALMGRSNVLGSPTSASASVMTHSGARRRSLRLVAIINRAAATSAMVAGGTIRDDASRGP